MEIPLKDQIVAKQPHSYWLWLVIAVLIAAILSGGITYLLVRPGYKTTSKAIASVTTQIAEDLSTGDAQAALEFFNAQPASYRSTQSAQLQLSSIYISAKNYQAALKTAQSIGAKWGWNYYLALQAAQAATAAKSYTSALQYYQQATSLIQSQITILHKIQQSPAAK